MRSLVVISLGYIPEGRKSPLVALPRGIPVEKVTSEIPSKITELDEVMARCASIFGSRAKVLDHPILGPFSVNQWSKFHLVHGLHHLKQIHRLRTMLTSEADLSIKKQSARV